jgi:transcriptional regulator GlxA family with amidase domain
MAAPQTRRFAIVLFDGFELMDVFGPLALLGRLPDDISIALLGPEAGPVRSHQGTEIVATSGYASSEAADVVMVPGGQGTRRLVADRPFLHWLATWTRDVDIISSVCTGSALLAAAGLLDGFRATSNKRAFGWVSGYGRNVTWVPSARWVVDGNRWTSSGVTAGMDMTVALLTHLYGRQRAERVVTEIEYVPCTDATRDPFAVTTSATTGVVRR